MENVTDFLEQACGIFLFCLAVALCFEGFKLLENIQEAEAVRQTFRFFI